MPDKEKLSDIYNRTTPILGRKVGTFGEAYPTIAKLELTVSEDKGMGGVCNETRMSERSFQPIVNCSNPLCYGGGVNVGRVLHDIAGKKQAQVDSVEMCQGREGTKTKKSRTCLHRFHVVGEITYLSAV